MGVALGPEDVGLPEAADPGAAGVVGVRLYTRAPVTVPWVSRAIVPVARALREDGLAVHLRRGWLHGPHVDVVARPAPAHRPDWAGVAASLDAGGSVPALELGEEEYLAQARELGRLEAVASPYLPLRAHGTVELLGRGDVASASPPLDDLTGIVSSVLAKPLLDAVDELAAHPERAPARLAEMFLALADTHALGAAYGVFSLRSHVEAFLAWASPTRDVRPAFQARLAADAARLRPLVEQRLAGAPGPAAAAWRTSLGYCAGVLDSAVARGELTGELLEQVTAGLDTSRMGPPGAPEQGPRGGSPDSDFHRAVDASGVVAEPSQWFAAYRMLINLFYRQLPLLTVSPMQRYYTCFAVAETVDEVLGQSWQDRLLAEQVRASAAGRAR